MGDTYHKETAYDITPQKWSFSIQDGISQFYLTKAPHVGKSSIPFGMVGKTAFID